MPTTSSATQADPARQRFLVHAARGVPLNDFLAVAETDPDIAVIDIIGPRDQPHTAVVELTADKAQRLAQHFRLTGTPAHQLTIEPDRPLSMFNSPFDPF